MEKNKNKNWIMQGSIATTLLIIILGSFASPILIYVALLFIGVLSVINMYRMDRHIAEQDIVKPEEVPNAPVEEPKQELTLEQKNAIEGVATFINTNIAKGHDLKTVVEALIQEGYTKEFVMDICVQMGIVEVKEPKLPDLGEVPKPEVKEPVEEVKEETPIEKPKKKVKKKKKAEKPKEEVKEEAASKGK